MKNNLFFKRSLFSYMAIFSGALLLTLAACDKDDDDVDDDNTYAVSGNASGSQEVPAVTTTATGSLSGTYNATTNSLSYTITWTGLSGIATDAHLHGPAAIGVSAGVLVPLTITTNAATGTATGTATLTDDAETALLSGNVYYNIHTVANVDGEIRGQIVTAQ